MNARAPSPLLVLVIAAALGAVLFAAGCGSKSAVPTAPDEAQGSRIPGPERAAELGRAIAAQEASSSRLLAISGVIGTGAGLDPTGHARVLVLLERGGVAGVPGSVGGIPVASEVLGAVHPWSLTGTYRPVPIGVSVGNNAECLPGTIGCVLERGGKEFFLSANHVFARQNQGVIGEDIVQPSRPDGSADCAPEPPPAVVAHLADFEPVEYDGRSANVMDAAIAEVSLPTSQISCGTPAGYYGFPGAGIVNPSAHLRIKKLGRTTGLTLGEIKAVNVKTKITFPSGVAYFIGQFLTSPGFGDFGDSGSLVVSDDGTNRAVGMVIGGTNNGSAIASPIGPILTRFNATICTR